MATYTKLVPSGGVNGLPILVVPTATPGTVFHLSHATDLDEIWLWAINTDATDRKLTVEFGGVASPKDLIEKTIVAEDGPQLIVPGIPVTGTVTVAAFAAAANLITMFGYVNRITP